jgi:hypothetical protein
MIVRRVSWSRHPGLSIIIIIIIIIDRNQNENVLFIRGLSHYK